MYEIDDTVYKRFKQKNNMLLRRLWDKTLPTYNQMIDTNLEKHIASKKEGYSRLDFALVAAGWTVYEKFPHAFTWERKELIDIGYGVNWMKSKYVIEDWQIFTYYIKKAAKFYGASIVGIADVNENWIYKTGFKRPEEVSEAEAKQGIRGGTVKNSIYEQPIELPNGINKVIVMGIEMDRSGISTAPAQPAAAAAAIAYSKMAFVIACLGEFIRNLGYKAIQSGNDTALSIPIAIDAGLGALGRHGLLITPEYGPRVRICKVFTDLPLISDKPNWEFVNHIENFCKNCFKCAKVCETKAISDEKNPSFQGKNISNNSGVKKYYTDGEKCFEFWVENSSDCGACISICPFSKIRKIFTPDEFWDNI